MKRPPLRAHVPPRWVAPFTGAWIETRPGKKLSDANPSPPSRGRGLKHQGAPGAARHHGSPPSRGRGLKRPMQAPWRAAARSPPSRGRGLKLGPHVVEHQQPHVAPFTGAWIETRRWPDGRAEGESPPSRGRGLKLGRRVIRIPVRVAPFTGAWTETRTATSKPPRALSSPSWVCGLKLLGKAPVGVLDGRPCHRAWAETATCVGAASFTRMWIETTCRMAPRPSVSASPFAGRGPNRLGRRAVASVWLLLCGARAAS